jgi:hypothetical protein
MNVFRALLCLGKQKRPDTDVHFLLYWDVKDMGKFLAAGQEMQMLSAKENNCIYFGFTKCSETKAVSKEGYRIAEGFLEHLQNIDGPLRKALDPKVGSISQIDVHGPATELNKLREPLKDFPVTYWNACDGAFSSSIA